MKISTGNKTIQINTHRPLREVLNELLEVEKTEEVLSISGTIVEIAGSLYILSMVAYTDDYSPELGVIDRVNWALISIECANRFFEPMKLEELFAKLITKYHDYYPIKVIGHISEYKNEFYKIIGLEK